MITTIKLFFAVLATVIALLCAVRMPPASFVQRTTCAWAYDPIYMRHTFDCRILTDK